MSGFSHYEACPRCRDRGKDQAGDNLAVWRDGSGHCFSCGYHKFPTHYVPKLIEDVDVPKSVLPSDFQREVPAGAWKWLLQYGMPYSYWQEHCGYSEEKGERLIFTVGKPVQFSIGRYIGTDGARKWCCWGDAHKHCEVIGRGEVTVLVEDLISAHKVGQVTEAIPLFGTEVHPCHLYAMRGSKSPVVLWLDADQGGSTSKKAMRLQSLLHRPVHVVHTKDDPKLLSTTKIKEVLDKM